MFRDIDPRSVGYLTGIFFKIYLALNTRNAVTLWVRKPANRYVKCDLREEPNDMNSWPAEMPVVESNSLPEILASSALRCMADVSLRLAMCPLEQHTHILLGNWIQ